ncbi:MAG TPA: T9SS type A sorting domain-containing protein, partial [Bacteroidia bacterium]|nr:T9SS type A sorting domain-containing protein [Bacteroidia bacterium]
NNVGGTGSAVTNGSITSSSFTTFSKFTLANAAGGTNPLPVELVSFTATPENDQVNLDWITMSELNNDYFTVEKSTDGNSFTEIARITGAGNSKLETNYHTVDSKPVKGLNYYRLKQTDFDGEFAYSTIITVNLGSNAELSINAYPNPAIYKDIYVNVNGTEGEQVKIALKDVFGKEYYGETIVLDGATKQLIINKEERMPPGIYFIVATSNSQMYTYRIVIQ